MASSKASRKRQTRLAFTPLPSSSPASKHDRKQIQDRATAVSYEGSPSSAKRRKASHKTPNAHITPLDGQNDGILTPEASLGPNATNAQGGDGDDESEPVTSNRRKRSTRDNVTFGRTDGPQGPSGSVAMHSSSSPMKLRSSSHKHSSPRSGIFSSPATVQVVCISSADEAEDSDALPDPADVSHRSKAKSSGKRMSNSAGKIKNSAGSKVPWSLRSMRESSTAGKMNTEESGIVTKSGLPQVDGVSDDEDEDDMPTTTGRQARTRKRLASIDQGLSSSPPRAVYSDDDLQIIGKPSSKHRRVQYHDDNVEEEDDAEEPVTPSRRKLRRPRQLSRQEEEDLADDLDFLQPSSDLEETPRQLRNTQSVKKAARQQALEKLKRKRSSQQYSGGDGDIHSEEQEDEQDDFYDDDENQQVPLRDQFEGNEDDEDFIEMDDEDGQLGVPEELPLEYSRYKSMKAGQLFPFAVEWMVQKKINPAFQMDDEIYILTFRKLSDEVTGLAGSKFVSAAWTPQYTIALKSRPDLAYSHFDRDENFFRDKCDACNRSSHTPTFEVQFQGKPYHPETLEEIGAHDDDDDDDEDSSEEVEDEEGSDARDLPSRNHLGQDVPPENTIFYVGRFCMANTETAHALTHWRYHLNEWVVDWLTQQGYLSEEKIVRRDRLSTGKRRKEANRIADRMEQEGVTKRLYKDFKRNIDEARNSKQGRFEGVD